jgi:hypothetical protein
MAAVMRLPRVIGRASLALIALLDVGAVLLAIHAPSVASVAAAVAGPMFVVVPLVGVYVAVRRPSNPVGWIFLAAGVALSIFAFSGSYAYQVLSQGPPICPPAAPSGGSRAGRGSTPCRWSHRSACSYSPTGICPGAAGEWSRRSVP